jgi:hypothetical protein
LTEGFLQVRDIGQIGSHVTYSRDLGRLLGVGGSRCSVTARNNATAIRKYRPMLRPLSPRWFAAVSRRRLHGKELAVAHGRASRKPCIGRHQCDERPSVITWDVALSTNQQASRAKNTTQVRHQPGYSGRSEIEKESRSYASGSLRCRRRPRRRCNQRDGTMKAGAREVGRASPMLVFSRIPRSDRAGSRCLAASASQSVE